MGPDPRLPNPAGSAGLAAARQCPAGLFFVNDEEWRRQRRLVMAALDPAHVHAYFPSLQKVVQRLRGRWRQAAAEGRAIDVQADLMRYTVDVVAGLAFGSDVNTLEGDDPIQTDLNRVLPALGRRLAARLPYWRRIRTRADRELEQSVVVIRSAIDGFIRAARAQLARDPARRLAPTNLLEAMLVAAEADAGISDADVAGNVLVMLVAGEDTTANTITWLIHFLFDHPHALGAARDEVRRVGAQDPSLSLDTIGRLVYLEACLHETMRLKPVAPVQTAQANRDVVVGDVAVPAGAIVVGLVRADATSARHFADPQRFDPARWLATDERTRASPDRVSMPFGAGPRLCPGRYLALLEMKVAAAMLLDGFDLERVGTRHGGPPEELFSFAMAPRELGMRLRLR
ncbi:cytochrome P450 [Piscinibacter koreensis]|uniref:Cytochrome P450 n=1 Tax=Piscinibacter koreensis TaxID=2742824 RepID=A0A7Y6NRH9_9BURK|nr:cytochrome P450 [Schlegelella koreensis]